MRIATQFDRHGVTLARLGLLFAGALAAFEAFIGGGLDIHRPWDKFGHFGVFYTLTVLSLAAFPRAPVLRLMLVLVAIGGAVELIQSIPVVGRDAEWGDFFADITGVCFAVIPAAAWRVRRAARAA
jgi:VanZ family protein